MALIHSENLGQNSVLSTILCNNNSGSAELLRTKFYSWQQASEKFPKDEKVVNKITFTNLGHSGGAWGCWSPRGWPRPQAQAAEWPQAASGQVSLWVQSAGANHLCPSPPMKQKKERATVLLFNVPGFDCAFRKLCFAPRMAWIVYLMVAFLKVMEKWRPALCARWIAAPMALSLEMRLFPKEVNFQ